MSISPLPQHTRRLLVGLVVLGLVVPFLACQNSSGGGSSAPPSTGSTGSTTTTTGTGSTSTPSGTVTLTEAIPVVFVHGIGGNPKGDWGAVLQRIARGREVFEEIYAGDSDLLPTDGVRKDSLFAFGYYREQAGSPEFYTDRVPELPGIGGCPAPRTDGFGARYTISYAEQLDRTVENICRATGSDRIDLVCFSMGGLVGRAYTRWHSLKAPNGLSRVRRLLTIGTMNHGLNSLEATATALSHNGVRQHVRQGEAAELNYQCTYWGGRSFIDLLNDGWDAYCQTYGIEYGAGYGYGNSYFHNSAVQNLATMLNGLVAWLVPFFLEHPTPNFDVNAAATEAMGDSDGVVRVSSSRMDPARYPNVRFNARFYGKHCDFGNLGRSVLGSCWCEALIRRFIFENRSVHGFSIGNATIEAVDAGGEATWLKLDVDVTGGEPLAAQVLLRTIAGHLVGYVAPTFGLGTDGYGAFLYPGTQRHAIDPAISDGDLRCELRLYGFDDVVELPALNLTIDRSGPTATRPEPTIGTPTLTVGGDIEVAVTAGTAPGEVSWALDDGSGASWSAFQPEGTLAIPALAEGEYELRIRARSADNAAGTLVEEPRPAAVRLHIDASGQLTVTR